MSRVVLDTNVVVAAFAAHGLCESVFELFFERHDLFISDHLINELEAKFQSKLFLPSESISEILNLYTSRSTILTPIELSMDVCRDPEDIPVLGLCQAAEAEFLVTGDKDLLTLITFDAVKIVNPREFHTAISKK
jgi:putative PIN family toxin of toxin-antitoxin system